MGWIGDRVDTERYSIWQFVRAAARALPRGTRILDLGAGDGQYKGLFRHCAYESCDWGGDRVSFQCDVQRVPVRDHVYDAVLCTQVLDDVPDPQRLIDEVARVLKPGGRLYLTAPQGWWLHSKPFHYFNFTNYGLALLCQRAGLDVVELQPRGGAFWLLGHRSRALLVYLERQHPAAKWFFWPLKAVTRYAIPLAFFYLDRFDRDKDWTLGYALIAAAHVQS